jgi:hypothetical protein
MTTNIGAQAATAVNEKLVERQKLEQELYEHHQDLGTLISQRNENEMVKEVRGRRWIQNIACLDVTILFDFFFTHIIKLCDDIIFLPLVIYRRGDALFDRNLFDG